MKRTYVASIKSLCQCMHNNILMHPLTVGFLLIALLISATSVSADVLYLNEGEEHVGRLKAITPDLITFTDVDGKESSWPASAVAHILLSQIRPGDEHDRIEKLTDPLAKEILQNLPRATDFPDSDFVTLYRNRTFDFQADGSIVYEQRFMILILKEPGLDMANISRYYNNRREKFELLFAHTYAPDGHVYHITDDAISDEAIYTSTPEYDLIRKTKFALKKVDLGSVIDVAFRVTSMPPDAMHPYLIDTVFGEREPVLREEFVVRFPKEREMIVENLHWTGPNLPKFTDHIESNGKIRVLKWIFSDPKGYIPEVDMPSTSRVFPRTWVYPRDDWSNLAKEFEKELQKAKPSDSLLDSFIKEIGVSADDSASAKVQKVYNAILKKIRLLPISLPDMGQVAPLPVDVALSKRYGNNQARVCLAHFTLKKLGINTEIGFTNYWNADEIEFKVPNLGQADYAILRVEVDGKVFYTSLDNDYLPFGHLPPSFQGARAVFLRNGTFVAEQLPEGGPTNNQFWRTVFAKLDNDGNFEVTEIRRPRGPEETRLRQLRAAKEREKLNFAQQAVKRVHPKAELKSFTLSNLDNFQAPVTFALQYRIPNAAIKASDRLLAFKNLWVSYNAGTASLATRTWPLEFWATEENVNSILIELPPGFRWISWNKDFAWDCGGLSYNSTITQQGNMLQFSDRFAAYRKLFTPGELYDHYRNCLMVMSDLAKQWIIIEREDTDTASDTKNIPNTKPTSGATTNDQNNGSVGQSESNSNSRNVSPNEGGSGSEKGADTKQQ